MASSRIEELRRRVQADPASIAFAQLAEEYRRSGQTDEAVRVCREGLTRHPGYLSARVTLGRALLDLSELDAARSEFEFVVAEAPENLAAVRGLAEISQRDGQLADALNYYRRALALARHDPEIEEIVQQLSRQVGVAATTASGGLSFEEAHQELLSAADRMPVVAPRPAPPPNVTFDAPTAPFDFERLVAALGNPTAPPQTEAAVAGHPGALSLGLADTVDLGPNPFAALEAELRAHETAPTGVSVDRADFGRYEGSAAKVGVDTTDPVALASTAAVLEDTMLAESVDLSWTASTAALADPVGFDAAAAEDAPSQDRPEAVAPAAFFQPVSDQAETVLLTIPTRSPAPLAADRSMLAIDDDGAADTLAAAERLPFPSTVAIGTEPPVAPTADANRAAAEVVAAGIEAAAPPSSAGDVLDDLESWLSTLHDRSAP